MLLIEASLNHNKHLQTESFNRNKGFLHIFISVSILLLLEKQKVKVLKWIVNELIGTVTFLLEKNKSEPESVGYDMSLL